MNYTKKRYLTYFLITIFTMVLPFITINGNHMLLLSFDKLRFEFLGFAYNMNELYVMPFLLMFLFIGIFAMTAMFGRVWCGWACPQTIFRVIYRDLIETKLLGMRKLNNKQKNIDYDKNNNYIKKYIAIFIWIVLSTIITANFMWYFVPPEDFFAYLLEPREHLFMILFMVTLITLLLFDIIFMKEDFCTYACPYSRIQSVLYDDDTKQVVYNTNRGGDIYQSGEKSITNIKQWASNEECTTCEACVKVCPTHIDIRKGLQVECINCLECSDACSSVMGKLGKPSLIYWGSTNGVINTLKKSLFNFRNNMYIAALALSLILAGVFAAGKESMLVNINRTTKLYSIKEDNLVTNNYLITLHNRSEQNYSYDIQLHDPRFKIKRFKSPSLNPDKRVKSVLIIKTTEHMRLSNRKDTPLSLDATFYAKEDPSIKINKKLTFIYPRNDLFR